MSYEVSYSEMKAMFRDAERNTNMVTTVGERNDLQVKTTGSRSYTDLKNVVVASPTAYIKMGLTRKEAEKVCLYSAGHEGAHTLLSSTEEMRKQFTPLVAKGYNKEMLNVLMQITEDLRVDTLTALTRPGYSFMREEGFVATMKALAGRPSGSKEADMLRAISCITYGHTLSNNGWDKAVDWAVAKEMADIIAKVIDMPLSNSGSSVLIAKEVYDKLYGVPKKPNKTNEAPKQEPVRVKINLRGDDPRGEEEENDDEDGGGGTGDNSGGSDDECPDSGDSPSCGDNDADGDDNGGDDGGNGGRGDDALDDGETGDGGGAGGTDEEDDGVEGDDTEGAGDKDGGGEDYEALEIEVKNLIESGLTKSVAERVGGRNVEEKIETLVTALSNEAVRVRSCISTVESANNKKHLMDIYGKKVFNDNDDAAFVKKVAYGTHEGVALYYAEDDNRSARRSSTYMFDAPTYEGMSRKLGTTIMQALRAARDPDGYSSDNGHIVAKKAWMPDKVGSSRIFKKDVYEEVGDYAVSVLLDASGSQGWNKEYIRVQAYVLAEAFSIAGIPCQVLQFHDRLNHNVLWRIRDFDAPRGDNKKCFDYKVDGSNRDGMAIRAAAELLKMRSEENKILIVLSDGQPASSLGRGSIGVALNPYMGQRHSPKGVTSGTDDTAMIVRKARSEGIHLLGVYTGEPSNEDAIKEERYMFGNDFAFIPSMSDFANVVGKYILGLISRC